MDFLKFERKSYDRKVSRIRHSSSHAPAPDAPNPGGGVRPPDVAIERDAAATVGLRLAIGKDGLGIELSKRAPLSCFDVVELIVRLPQVRFPFDVTGGVAKFRHRRGELERLALELDTRRCARWAEPLLRGLLGPGACSVTIAARAFGATVTVLSVDERTIGVRRRLPPAALAFEVALVAEPELTLVVHTARGVNLPGPATLLALRAIATLLGDSAKREGARFVIAHAASRIARALLPDAGVRAPAGDDVVLVGSGESDGVLFLAFARDTSAPPIPQAATLADETARLVRASDDARFSNDLSRARQLDLAALERAPRHGEVARRIAELDAHVGGRAEAAIATLRSSDRAAYLGQLLGELLVEAGDVPGAIASFLREGERDPSSAVAALCYARAAALSIDPTDALSWLDAAIARAPSLTELRWERATRRLSHGRLSDARADFQELEALASGARERYEVLRRAADTYRTRGLGSDAAILYERALLYRPDDPAAVAGLGVALAAEGRPARGAALLARAIESVEARDESKARRGDDPKGATSWMELELARVLGDRLGDRPTAIAHLRLIPDEAPEAIEARGLEGRYRASLGDVAGATLAFARLRERAGKDPAAIPWLEEAARFEEERGELAIAQAHLLAALTITPTHAELEDRYRTLSARIARAVGMRDVPHHGPEAPELGSPAGGAPTNDAPHTRFSRDDDGELGPRPYDTNDAPHTRLPLDLDDGTLDDGRALEPRDATAGVTAAEETPFSPEEDEARVEALTLTLQGDPTNDVVVDELTVRLTRLGRSMDLLALLSARLEDAPPERREELLPRHRAVLERLELEARAAGRDAEADLFRMARDAS